MPAKFGRGYGINLVYCGNIGVAQDVFLFGELAYRFKAHESLRMSFYGRGADKQRFTQHVESMGCDNVAVYDEVDPAQLKRILSRSDGGLLALDTKHTTSNIPGKFLTYMEAGVPVLAKINAGNDLIELIEKYDVGTYSVSDDLGDLQTAATELCHKIRTDPEIGMRCKKLAREIFSIDTATRQIVDALR